MRAWAVNLQQCFTDAFRTIFWTSKLKDNNEEITDELQKQIAEIHQPAKDNLMQPYLPKTT